MDGNDEYDPENANAINDQIYFLFKIKSSNYQI